MPAETIIHNAKIATNAVPSFVDAIAIERGKVTAVGTSDEILGPCGPPTDVIGGKGRTVIPGLNDSHKHPIRGGLNYDMELRWDGAPSLADALRMLKEQAARTPAPQWVRVVGGWIEFQFAERRMPVKPKRRYSVSLHPRATTNWHTNRIHRTAQGTLDTHGSPQLISRGSFEVIDDYDLKGLATLWRRNCPKAPSIY